MKITAGPTITAYAELFDVPIDEVLEWANGAGEGIREYIAGQVAEERAFQQELASMGAGIGARIAQDSSGETNGLQVWHSDTQAVETNQEARIGELNE